MKSRLIERSEQQPGSGYALAHRSLYRHDQTSRPLPARCDKKVSLQPAYPSAERSVSDQDTRRPATLTFVAYLRDDQSAGEFTQPDDVRVRVLWRPHRISERGARARDPSPRAKSAVFHATASAGSAPSDHRTEPRLADKLSLSRSTSPPARPYTAPDHIGRTVIGRTAAHHRENHRRDSRAPTSVQPWAPNVPRARVLTRGKLRACRRVRPLGSQRLSQLSWCFLDKS